MHTPECRFREERNPTSGIVKEPERVVAVLVCRKLKPRPARAKLMKLNAELRHRIHTVIVHAHRNRRSAEQVRENARNELLGPDVDPQHEVRLNKDTVVHLWVEEHAEAGWCHRVKLSPRVRRPEVSLLPQMSQVLSLLGLRPLLYEHDAVWRSKDHSIQVMQPLVRPRQHR